MVMVFLEIFCFIKLPPAISDTLTIVQGDSVKIFHTDTTVQCQCDDILFFIPTQELDPRGHTV